MAFREEVGELWLGARVDASNVGRDLDTQVGGGLTSFAKKAAGLMAGVFAVGAIKDFVGSALTAFSEFETGMNEVFTLLPDASQAAMDSMSDDVLTFSSNMGVLPEETIPALYQSLSAGVPQDNVFAFLETAQQAAMGGVTDLETAVDGISSVVNAYGTDVISAGEASDLMFTAVRLGKTNFEELSSSLFNVTPMASALGVEFDQVTAALAAMTAQGTPTSVATTQLRQLFVELSRAGGEADTVFREMAGESFQEFMEAGGSLEDALALMATAAEDSGVKLQDMFGSVEAGSAALQLAGNEAFSDALVEMGDAAGATEAAFDQMDQGTGRSIERMQAKFAVFKIRAGEALAPIAEALMDFALKWAPIVADAIQDMVETVQVWIERNRQTFEDGFNRVREIVETIIEIVTAAWEIFGDQIVEFTVNYVTLIIERVQILWDFFSSLIEFIVAVFTGDWDKAWEEIKDIFVAIWELMVNTVEIAWETLKLVVETIIEGVKLLWDWSFLSDWVSDAWDAVMSFFLNAPARIANAWIDIHAKILEIAVGIFDTLVGWVGDAVQAAMDFFLAMPARLVNAGTEIASRALAMGQTIFSEFVNGLGNLGQALVDLLREAWEAAVGFFNSLNPINFAEKIPVVGDVVSTVTGAFDRLTPWAEGGRPPVGVPAIIGERGPELWVPDVAGTIIPNHDLGSFSGGSGVGGGGITFGPGSVVVYLPNASAAAARSAGEIVAEQIIDRVDGNRRDTITRARGAA